MDKCPRPAPRFAGLSCRLLADTTGSLGSVSRDRQCMTEPTLLSKISRAKGLSFEVRGKVLENLRKGPLDAGIQVLEWLSAPSGERGREIGTSRSPGSQEGPQNHAGRCL